MSTNQKRLDQWLVELQLAPSKTKAQELIENGNVQLGPKILDKPSHQLNQEEAIRLVLLSKELLKYVSRGGLKIEFATQYLKLSIKDKTVLDIGCSTGGFSDFLLQSGAKSVVGIDVGSEQIHHSLKNKNNFAFYENLHFEKAEENLDVQSILKNKFDLIVADLSFISVTRTFPYLKRWLKPHGQALLLVKPQFELSKNQLNKKGVVKSFELYQVVKEKIISSAEEHQLKVINYFESQPKGRDGNLEFFILLSLRA